MLSFKQYIKNGEVVFANPDNVFIYETNVYSYYSNLFCLSNSTQYKSAIPIEKVVRSFWKTPHIQICTDLFAAPERWLRDNGYSLVKEKPKKQRKNKNEK